MPTPQTRRRIIFGQSYGSANQWWLAGGAPEPYAVYSPADAASLAASYLRVAGSGGYANLDPAVVGGVAPNFSLVGNGWVYTYLEYLKSGVTAGNGYTLIVRADTSTNGRSIAGSATFWIRANSGSVEAVGSNYVAVGAAARARVLAIAGTHVYADGVPVITTLNATGISGEIYIGWDNAGSKHIGTIQRVAIYNTSTDHATWVPAVSAAMKSL